MRSAAARLETGGGFCSMNLLLRLSVAAMALTNLALSAAGPLCTPQGAHVGMDPKTPERLGAVSFENSCKPEVQSDLNRAVALLHSFWLDEAERTFMQVSIADPDCAMAFWGVAMADFNEVNGGPTEGGFIRATQALAPGHNCGPLQLPALQSVDSKDPQRVRRGEVIRPVGRTV